MYNWRKMTDAQRRDVLEHRQLSNQPWHSPPQSLAKCWYHISAACDEHAAHIVKSPERMGEFEATLTQAITAEAEELLAWCILPNHYHVLVHCMGIDRIRKALGKLHGRMSHE